MKSQLRTYQAVPFILVLALLSCCQYSNGLLSPGNFIHPNSQIQHIAPVPLNIPNQPAPQPVRRNPFSSSSSTIPTVLGLILLGGIIDIVVYRNKMNKSHIIAIAAVLIIIGIISAAYSMPLFDDARNTRMFFSERRGSQMMMEASLLLLGGLFSAIIGTVFLLFKLLKKEN